MPRKEDHHQIGEKVIAKWPGSTIYYPGTVVGHDEWNEIYSIKFEDNSERVEVLSKHVLSAKRTRSWRSSSASPSRSPGRTRRARSRSKSPSRGQRRQRSPARKATPSTRRRKPSPEKSPEKETETKQVDVDMSATRKASSKTVETTDGQSHTNVIKEEKSVVTRRVTRSVMRVKDEENKIEQTSTPVQLETKLATPSSPPKVPLRSQFEAAFSIILLQLFILALCFVCGDKHQAFTFAKWPKIPDAKTFLDWRWFIAVGCWFDIQFLLTLLPIGKVYLAAETKDGKRLEYRMNGLFLMALNTAVFGILTYFKYIYIIADLVDSNYLKFATSCILVSLVAGILVMIKAKVEEKAGFTPYNFLNGVQVNPRFLNIDFKLASAKSGIFLWIGLNFCFLLKQYNAGGKADINYATLAVVIFQFVYIMHTWYHETVVIESRDIRHEKYGFGFAFLSLAVLPLFYSMQVLFLSRISPAMTPAKWIATILFQVIGFYIYDKSNREKAEFRHELKKAMKKEMKVVFTSDGKNLLADGWWGRLRHPNYLGDIMIAISWALPAGFTHILPWLYPVLLVALLIFRARDDDAYCAEKYGLSWDEYKARVKYVIFPYIY